MKKSSQHLLITLTEIIMEVDGMAPLDGHFPNTSKYQKGGELLFKSYFRECKKCKNLC